MKILIPVDETPHRLAAVDFVASRCALVGRDPDVLLFQQPRLSTRRKASQRSHTNNVDFACAFPLQ